MKIAFIFTSLSTAHIYDFYIFTVIYLSLQRFIWNQHSDQFPVGFFTCSSGGRALHLYCILNIWSPNCHCTNSHHLSMACSREKWMILTKKCLWVDIFHTRRLSKSLAFSQFARVISKPYSIICTIRVLIQRFCLFVSLLLCWPVCFSFIHKHSLIHLFLKTLQQNCYIYQVSINTMVLLL